jgi:hypothetical protein
MITCTITLDSRVVATATAADQGAAAARAWSQVSDFPLPDLAARCDFHFFPDTLIETAEQIAARFDLEFDDLLPDTDVVYPMNVEDCVLEHLYERGAYIGKTDAGIEYYPSQLI